MKTDTPETDKHIGMIYRNGSPLLDTSRRLEIERDEARRLAEKYRNISCDSQDEADETLLPWETTNPNEL